MSLKPELRVGDVMATEIISINGLATVSDAMALMRQHNVNSLVVNRRDEDDEIGLILVSDIARRVIAPIGRRTGSMSMKSCPSPSGRCRRKCWRATPCVCWRAFEISRAVVVDHDRNPSA